MPHNHEWQERIKGVEREFVVMCLAAERFQRQALIDPTILPEDVKPKDITTALDSLEGTYIVRLFADFETAIRQFWETRWDTQPTTVGLMDGLKARRDIPPIPSENAHLVRIYRNSLVHERTEIVSPMDLVSARKYLCRFLSYLPRRW